MHRPFSVGKRAFFIEAHTHTRTRSTIRYDTSIIMDFTGKRPFTAFDGIVSEQPVRFSYHIAQTNTRIIREPCLKYARISRLHRFSIAMDIENMKISATQSHTIYVESHSRYIHSAIIIVMITILFIGIL